MPPRSKRWKACAIAREAKAIKKEMSCAKDDDDKTPQPVKNDMIKTNPSCVVLGTLLGGTNFQTTRTILTLNGCNVCSKSTFYATQSKILPVIENLAKDSCREALQESVTLDHDQFSQDSRWSSLRHGRENTNTMIDVVTKKCISYYDSIKSRENLQGNYDGASNMMESNGLHHIAAELRDAYGDRKLKIAHDGDNKSYNVLLSEALNVEYYRDNGHAQKSLRNAFNAVRRSLNFIGTGEQPFYGVIEKMLSLWKVLGL